MKNLGGIIFFVVMIVGIIVLISYADSDNNRKKNLCENKGGTWLYHEQKCLDIRRIPVE